MEPVNEKSAAEYFSDAVAIMARLRGPQGCPWDREQDFGSIRKYTLEETYEVFDAIETRDWTHLKEELGDLLLQILFYAQMAAEAGYFTVAEVIEELNQKLVRRHPHVFGEEAVALMEGEIATGLTGHQGEAAIDTASVLRNWETIKQAEKRQAEKRQAEKRRAEKQQGDKQQSEKQQPAGRGQGDSASKEPSEGLPEVKSRLAVVPRSMPALMEAQKLGSRASKVGFDWPDVEGLFAKLQEEGMELREAITRAESSQGETGCIEDEVGDLLFTMVNLARRLDVDPEMALRRSNSKFRSRFSAMERMEEVCHPLEQHSATELEQLWLQAKQRERELSELHENGNALAVQIGLA